MERWLTGIWYGHGAFGWLLWPLAWLFGLVTAARRLAYRRGWLRRVAVGRPVVVVGNLSVGGTGKTPLVLWLAQALRARGHSVAVVARGYGRRDGAVRVVDADAPVQLVGDEALMMARRGDVPVIVGRDRVAAARLALNTGAALIICDDGLQHLRLARDFEIVVVDAERGFGNGRLLPAGPLRESVRRLASVDAVVENASAAPSPGAPRRPLASPALRLRMRLVPEPLRRLGDPGERRTLESLRGLTVHAVAGIGNPSRFFALLRSCGVEPIEHPFADHHAYAAGELDFSPAAPIVMTEKDAVKCAGLAADAWYLPVSAELEGGEELIDRLEKMLGKAPRER